MTRSAVIKTPATAALDRGRRSLRANRWRAAFTELSAADELIQLDPTDLEELAGAAHLIGREAECADFLTRAHQEFLGRGEIQGAVRCAYRLGFIALINGDFAQSGGWFSRAERLLEGQPDCVERGYLLLPGGYRAVHTGDPRQEASGGRWLRVEATPPPRLPRTPNQIARFDLNGVVAGFSWIDLPIFGEDNRPEHERGIVEKVPGMYFVGLHFLYAMSSASVIGVGRDAGHVVRAIAKRNVTATRRSSLRVAPAMAA